MQLSEFCGALVDAGFQAQLEGEDRTIHAVNTLEDASEGELTFLSNPKYLPLVEKTKASAIVVGEGTTVVPRIPIIRSNDPYGAITLAIIRLHGHRRHPQWGLSLQAVIHPSAMLGENANVAGGVTIAARVAIGKNCTIYPGCFLGDGVQVGDDCTLYPNVVIYDGSRLGRRVTIHAGSVIGEDGLGYAPKGESWVKIPQTGRVVIGDDVEIGANCTIDRATLGQTEIGAGTKFGNVIVIGHGTKIGPDCMFVGLVGVAGSVTVGRHVTLAGQVGVSGHLAIGDGATVAAQSGITGNVEAKATLFGSPAIPVDNAKRSMYVFQRLPDWVRRIKDLEREVRDLREKLNGQVDQSRDRKGAARP